MRGRLHNFIVRGGALLVLAAAFAPSVEACEMCKNALKSEGHSLAMGINTSVLFMIGMVFSVFFGFVGLVRWTYHRERTKAASGAGFTPAGKLRWTSADDDAS